MELGEERPLRHHHPRSRGAAGRGVGNGVARPLPAGFWATVWRKCNPGGHG